MDIKAALKLLPKEPGVYFMKNSAGTIIYVGKAKNLKARVSQYFQKNRNNSPKINEMICLIDSFDYTVTDTELEAFLLECRLIRELKPKYNRLLKNTRNYRYLKLTLYEPYPRLIKVNRKLQDNAHYFGPFTSEGSVDNSILFIKEYFPIRRCPHSGLKKETSGCLNYQLGNCLGPCRAVDIKKEYNEIIGGIINFLSGSYLTPIKVIHGKMKAAADELDFEKAVRYRDLLRGIRHVLGKERIIKVSRCGRNILAFERFGEANIKLFIIKGNKLLHQEQINIDCIKKDGFEEKLKTLILENFRKRELDTKAGLSQEEIDEAQIIHSYLKNKRNGIISFNIPQSRLERYNYSKILSDILKK